MQTRRRFTQTLCAAIPAAQALAAPNSKFQGVQIGAISYSFRALPADQVLPACLKIGISELELMSNHAEALVGAPAVKRGPGGTPDVEGLAALRKWRERVNMAEFSKLRKTFDASGVEIRLLTYNLARTVDDEEIEYSFRMAKALGVRAITSSTRIAVARRVAPLADKHKVLWGAHGHDKVEDPEEFSTPESFATAMALSKYIGVNLDIGHFTAANYDPVAYIREHHARITNLHLKDRKKNHGENVPWGQGDTPIKAVLQLLKKEKYDFPANVEYEYEGKDDPVTEVGRCIQYCREALAG